MFMITSSNVKIRTIQYSIQFLMQPHVRPRYETSCASSICNLMCVLNMQPQVCSQYATSCVFSICNLMYVLDVKPQCAPLMYSFNFHTQYIASKYSLNVRIVQP